MFDFTDCKRDYTRIYGGVNGGKIGIEYKDTLYLLKFPPEAKRNSEMSYANSSFSEYIACHIMESLGLAVQETKLGTYKDKIVVACKDFAVNGYSMKDFAFLKNSMIDNTSNGYGVELTEILATIEEQQLVPVGELKKFFWEMFIADALLGNFDRHNGNWGFLINDQTRDVKIAPIFDCGSCLYPQITEEGMIEVLNLEEEIEKRIYMYPNSALKENNVKINYVNFPKATKNEDCIKALLNITKRIDFNKIDRIVDETPYISENYKKFVKTMVRKRKELILDAAIDKRKIEVSNV